MTIPLSFDEVSRRVGVVARAPLGVHPIRVSHIIGSAGKAGKIGPDFLPLQAGPASANYLAIRRRMEAGEQLPPIVVYALLDRYFIIDGHTRVAAAQSLDIEFLDAYVTECLPAKESRASRTYYARRKFERATGLQDIILTASWRYHLLLDHLEGYRLYLERSRSAATDLPVAAGIWYRSQYLPTLAEIRRRKLRSRDGSTAGDVYTDILRVWAEEPKGSHSLREMLDRYDAEQQQGTVTRAQRLVSGVVDASLPKAVPPLALPALEKVAELERKADLDRAHEDALGLVG